MKSRNTLLQALLCLVLVISFVSPASVVGASSANVEMTDEHLMIRSGAEQLSSDATFYAPDKCTTAEAPVDGSTARDATAATRAGLAAGETWCFTFYNRLPAVYLYVDPVEIYYVHEDYGPVTPFGIDIDFNEIPELAEFAQLWYAPVPQEPICIQVTRDGDNIWGSFEFTHEPTGYDVSAELNGTINGNAVSFKIDYCLPTGLQNYSMPLSYSDCMSEMEGTVYYSLPAVLTAEYQGTIVGDTIQGTFATVIDGQWARWRYLDKEYACAWGTTREELLFDGLVEWRLSNLRLSGDFTVEKDGAPVTIHQFSGSNKNAVGVKLTATDEWPGVEKTVYEISKRDGSVARYEETGTDGGPTITEFTVNLNEVSTITYFSIDETGMQEQPHRISISGIQEQKAFKNEALARDTCFGLGSYYSVYFTIDYFRISDELSDVLFVDQICVSVTPYDSGIFVVALQLDRNGEELQKATGSSWFDIGAVDWENRKNNYTAHAQLRSTSPPGCERFLSKSSLPLIISPGGIIAMDIYVSDRVFSTEIPVKRGLFQRIWEWISPFESRMHNREIGDGIAQASFELSWQGSDLDLILHDPDGRRIDPEAASVDADINFLGSATHEQFTVLEPVPGDWTIEVEAIDVPDQGEEYTITVWCFATSDLSEDEPGPEVAFASLVAEGKLVIAYNFDPFTTVPTAVNGWTWYDPTLPPAQNNLANLRKHTAYWVKVTENCSFTYGTHTYPLAAGWNNAVWLGC